MRYYNNYGSKDGDTIHYQLDKMKIKHICHWDNLGGNYDMSLESVCCTECNIEDGHFTLTDVISGRINPLDVKFLIDKDSREHEEEKEFRITGKLPKHLIYKVRRSNPELLPLWEREYWRFDCYAKTGVCEYSAHITEDLICPNCKGSINE